MDRDQLIASLKSVIVSKKGGVHISEINGEYKELMGQNIPLKSVTGCSDLRKFLCSVPGVSVTHGQITATSVNTAHIEKMISKQKTKVERRVRVKRLDGAKKYSTQRYTNQTLQSSQVPRPKRQRTRFIRHLRRGWRPAGQTMTGAYATAAYSIDMELNQIHGWKVIGDDLMLSVLNYSWPYQYDPLCCSGLTIQRAITEIYRNGCPSRVIVALGSVDVLLGHSEEKIKWDMSELLHAIHAHGSDSVICTLPAVGISHNWDQLKKIMGLNFWIMQSCTQFIDLNAAFCNRDWTIDYTCYESRPVYVRGCSQALLLWSERGCNIVLYNLRRWQMLYYNSNYINSNISYGW